MFFIPHPPHIPSMNRRRSSPAVSDFFGRSGRQSTDADQPAAPGPLLAGTMPAESGKDVFPSYRNRERLAWGAGGGNERPCSPARCR